MQIEIDRRALIAITAVAPALMIPWEAKAGPHQVCFQSWDPKDPRPRTWTSGTCNVEWFRETMCRFVFEHYGHCHINWVR